MSFPSHEKEYRNAYRERCKGRINAKHREWYVRNRAKKLAAVRAAYNPAADKVKHLADPRRRMVVTAKHRAKKKGLPFDLAITDFEIPAFCPALGIPIYIDGGLDNSPQLDRTIPKLGYVRGNVTVISGRANRIKNDSTPEELQKISAWVSTLITSAKASTK